MKQIKYILFTTLLSMVLISNSYSQRNWNDQLRYPIYPMDEEWIIALNGGLSASSFTSWGFGGQLTKKINPFIHIRSEAYIHNVISKEYSIGKCIFAGLGINYSISEYLHGYSKSNNNDFYFSSCFGVALDNQNDVTGNIGFYGNIGVGFYTHIYKFIYFSVENKIFLLSNLSENLSIHNYLSLGILFRINSHTKFL